MFSARFNEKNKEACIAEVTQIQAPKFFHTQKLEEEPWRIFP